MPSNCMCDFCRNDRYSEIIGGNVSNSKIAQAQEVKQDSSLELLRWAAGEAKRLGDYQAVAHIASTIASHHSK